MILEKAWAKYHGSYSASDGGYTHTTLKELTGYAAETIFLQDKKEEEIIQIIKKSIHKRTIICANTDSKTKNNLVSRHAYTIINYSDKNPFSLQIRNPHGGKDKGVFWFSV